MNRFLLLVVIAFYGFRATADVRFATGTVYYFRITDLEQSERSSRMVNDLNAHIPGFKYTITNESGLQGWPFYRKFQLDEKLPVDSIMPPHVIFHIFKPYEEGADVDGSYLIEARLLPVAEGGSPILKFDMFQGRGNDWIRVVDLKDHPFPVAKYPGYEEQLQIIEETIIRSSFK